MSAPRPLSVVTTDQDALRALLAVHAPAAPRILDVTHNRGRIWRGLPYRPHRLDVDPALHAAGHTDTLADFRCLPFGPATWDVLVFDPPHITEAGSGIVGGPWATRFGTRVAGLGQTSISGLFEGFLREAARVLVPNGLVLAKIADQVHRGAYRWQARAFQNTAEALGFTCCDLLVKVRPSAITDPKWQHVYHVRKAHCYWLVLRNGPRCTARLARQPQRQVA